MTDSDSAANGVLALVIFSVFYFAPTIIAVVRKRQPLAVGMLNLFLGWTVLGWVGALVWAVTNPSPPAPQIR